MLPSLLDIVIVSIVTVAVAAIFGEAISRAVATIARRAGAHRTTMRWIRDTLRGLWIAAAAIALIVYTGIANDLTILTVSGIATIVISLSLQSVFSNIISGLFLLRDGAIRIGDVIEYSGVKGRVARVALRNTWIVTEKGDVAIIGNSALTGGPLVNHTSGPRMATELVD